MSTRIKTIVKIGKEDADLSIIKYWGGNEKGQMLQLNQGFVGYIQLTARDVRLLVAELTVWLQSQATERRKKLCNTKA